MHRSLRLIIVVAVLMTAGTAQAAGGNAPLEPAGNDAGDVPSLQRGARNFINYCSGCHSAQYVRFNSIARDLNLSKEQLIDNLMFNAERTFETIVAAMPAEDSARWFGSTPPDMSLMARARGTDYLYNFLKGFYLDPDSPTGVDNVILEGTSMPHVLWELQGFQNAVFHENELGEQLFERFEKATPGAMTSDEYDDFVRDTVNFMEYIGEPIRTIRRKMGVWVLMFLTVFLILSYMLKKQIWKDVS